MDQVTFTYQLVGGLRGIITGALASVAMFALMSGYDKLIDDPAIAKAAKMEFVDLSEKLAHAAQVSETRRQKVAVDAALEIYNHRLLVSQALAASQEDELKQRISKYEKLLADEGRSWLLDDADVEFVR